ncbi:MAG TPA: hypothetical protein VNI84_19195 [Pyrinomonadaceae bacterium]|nr:hypothetical protein [Pyrinomonadaceae bacterium]
MEKEFPKLILLDWQKDDDWLIRSKGWFDHNLVELENGNRYQVCFLDSVRLVQHLDGNTKNGQPFFIENNLIVLSEVTIENMQKAIAEAEKQGFFENLKPVSL